MAIVDIICAYYIYVEKYAGISEKNDEFDAGLYPPAENKF